MTHPQLAVAVCSTRFEPCHHTLCKLHGLCDAPFPEAHHVTCCAAQHEFRGGWHSQTLASSMDHQNLSIPCVLKPLHNATGLLVQPCPHWGMQQGMQPQRLDPQRNQLPSPATPPPTPLRILDSLPLPCHAYCITPSSPDELDVLLTAHVELHLSAAAVACQHKGALLLQLLHGLRDVPLHDAAPHSLAQLQSGAHGVRPTLTAHSRSGRWCRPQEDASKVSGKRQGKCTARGSCTYCNFVLGVHSHADAEWACQQHQQQWCCQGHVLEEGC